MLEFSGLRRSNEPKTVAVKHIFFVLESPIRPSRDVRELALQSSFKTWRAISRRSRRRRRGEKSQNYFIAWVGEGR